MAEPALILFDVDGTLIDSHRSGRDAMTAAGRTVFGPRFSFDAVAFAGKLDPVIVAEAAAASEHDVTDEQLIAFFNAYLDELKARLAYPPRPVVLPGVHDAVDALHQHCLDNATELGLLTGNYARAARLKLDAARFDHTRFTVNAFGDDAHHRADLVALARQRFEHHTGRAVAPDRTLVVGDTPLDVDAAHAHGCVAVGVATGSYDAPALAAAGADHVLDDLTAFPDLHRDLCNGA